MKPRAHVFMFKPRFAPLVASGAKCSTIRPVRDRVVEVGDILDLREWLGRPYRSKQRQIRREVCVEIAPVEIRQARVILGSVDLKLPAMQALARKEGFLDCVELCDWFQVEHGLPFKGVYYRWQP